MKRLDPIAVETAVELVDFGASGMSESVAREQLEGAVAVYNILARKGFAYLADEVGKGKTYIALGVVALLRFFHPDVRVLYIAPRENLQEKWGDELHNFTAINWRHRDQRVRSLRDQPAVRTIACANLVDWTRSVLADPHVDVFLRMPSFGFALPDRTRSPNAWRERRRQLLRLAPVVQRSWMDLRTRDKHHFKMQCGQVLNALLPHYDLVVVDEAHNLKRGRKTRATRNLMLAAVLGAHRPGEIEPIPGYERRFDRVLMLSATPLESRFDELWNQLDLFGFGGEVRGLIDGEDEKEQRRTAAEFLIRRLTGLTIAGERHTRNMYRREWRAGGMQIHDDPLEVPGHRQRLIVGLVQKKVAEVLADPRFNASFQIGMLASFESFLQTAGATAGDDAKVFEETEQADILERDGIDVLAVDRLAESYRKAFGEPMPHPKMDAVVERLSRLMKRGDKALAFVRRVMSVAELGDKLRAKYDQWLAGYLRELLPPDMHGELDEIWSLYRHERRRRKGRDAPTENPAAGAALDALEADDDPGGRDTFFAWFFRGIRSPGEWLSGAAFARNRLRGESSAYALFFEDNHVHALLGGPDDVLAALARILDRPEDEVERELRTRAVSRVSQLKRQRIPRYHLFHAYQEMALELLAGADVPMRRDAEVILEECGYRRGPLPATEAPVGRFDTRAYLGARTFFTELRRRPVLRRVLWPESEAANFRDRFRDRQVRRELLSSVARLGHTIIDLWALAVKGLGSMRPGAKASAAAETSGAADRLIDEFLDLLEAQRHRPGMHAYRELGQVGEHHDLIMRTNFPGTARAPLGDMRALFARVLAAQTPVGGMHGGVNRTLVRQFRMPGYPLILVCTDVLQEGEDLHTFCSRIVHYGISWTPSAMEQRTGRIDRIGSQVHRRLQALDRRAHPDELLQVHYPYLADTVERLQVQVVFRQMDEFMRLIHKGYGVMSRGSRVDVRTEIVQSAPAAAREAVLESYFPVAAHLPGGRRALGEPGRAGVLLVEHLDRLTAMLDERLALTWSAPRLDTERYGTVLVCGDTLADRDAETDPEDIDHDSLRRQPFALHLRPSASTGATLLHLVSPVGEITRESELEDRLLAAQKNLPGVKLCEGPGRSRNTYLLTVEGDMLFHPDTAQVEEVMHLLERIAVGADHLEQQLYEDRDWPLDSWRALMKKSEARRGSRARTSRR